MTYASSEPGCIRIRDRRIEELARAPNEGFTLPVFIRAWGFPDNHDTRVRIASAKAKIGCCGF